MNKVTNTTVHNIEQSKWSLYIKSGTYVEYGVEHIDEDPKLKVDDHVRISKYKNIFANCYTPNWPEEIFAIKKFKNILAWTWDLVITMMRKVLEDFVKKSCKRQAKNQEQRW